MFVPLSHNGNPPLSSSPISLRSSFTLIELLIVIGIVSILAVVVILVLNPAELLKQGRDAARISDLASINKSLNLFQTDGGSSLGTASTTYVSIPDPTATSTTLGNQCQGLGLPALPSGYTYLCSASSTYRNVDATGWIPVNFSSISFGSPLGILPVDPVNTTSSGSYYTYTSGGSWELTAVAESARNRSVTGGAGMDGGRSWNSFEVGTDLALVPIQVLDGGGRDPNLVGYWTFGEGSGTSAKDASGNGRTGDVRNGPSWQTGSSCKIDGCLSFDGVNDDVWIEVERCPILLGANTPWTLEVWIKPRTLAPGQHVVFQRQGDYGIRVQPDLIQLYFGGGDANAFVPLPLDTWTHIVGVWTGVGNNWEIYKNGTVVASGATVRNDSETGVGIIFARATNGGNQFDGVIDDIRVYNRALSAAEISAIYNATK